MAELDKCWGNRAAPWLLWSTAWVGEGLGGSDEGLQYCSEEGDGGSDGAAVARKGILKFKK